MPFKWVEPYSPVQRPLKFSAVSGTKSVNNSKIIFPNGSYTQILYPSNLVEFSSYASSGWIHNQLQLGNHGIYLTLIINDKEVEYKLNTELKEKLVLDK